eukprot:scaffold211344_cov22-Tisochrysis_lutea.AAC.2
MSLSPSPTAITDLGSIPREATPQGSSQAPLRRAQGGSAAPTPVVNVEPESQARRQAQGVYCSWRMPAQVPGRRAALAALRHSWRSVGCAHRPRNRQGRKGARCSKR